MPEAAAPIAPPAPGNKPKSAPQKAMEKLGLKRDIDLALHLPLRYEDETRLTPLDQALDGDTLQAEGEVVDSRVELRGRRQLLVKIRDEGGALLLLRFLHFYPSHQKTLALGARVRVRGEIRVGFFGREMVHPHFKKVDEHTPLASALTPVYPASAQLPQTYLRKAIASALQRAPLDELLPGWRDNPPPVCVPATRDDFRLLTKTRAWSLPTPPQMHNHGNFIVSLGALCGWLAGKAEALGVDVFPGFAASEAVFNDAGAVCGVRIGDMGAAEALLDVAGAFAQITEPANQAADAVEDLHRHRAGAFVGQGHDVQPVGQPPLAQRQRRQRRQRGGGAQTAKSCSVLPAVSASRSQAGRGPRPPQVLPDSSRNFTTAGPRDLAAPRLRGPGLAATFGPLARTPRPRSAADRL